MFLHAQGIIQPLVSRPVFSGADIGSLTIQINASMIDKIGSSNVARTAYATHIQHLILVTTIRIPNETTVGLSIMPSIACFADVGVMQTQKYGLNTHIYADKYPSPVSVYQPTISNPSLLHSDSSHFSAYLLLKTNILKMHLSLIALIGVVTGIAAAPVIDTVSNCLTILIPKGWREHGYRETSALNLRFTDTYFKPTTDLSLTAAATLNTRQSEPLGNGDIFFGCFNRRATIQDVHYLQDTGIGPPPAGDIGQAGQTISNHVNQLMVQIAPFSHNRVTYTSITPGGVRYEWTFQRGPAAGNIQEALLTTLAPTIAAILADALEGLVRHGTQSVAFSVRNAAGQIVLVIILRHV